MSASETGATVNTTAGFLVGHRKRKWGGANWVMLAIAVLSAWCVRAGAQAQGDRVDGPGYAVSKIIVVPPPDVKDFPAPGDFDQVPIELTQLPDGYAVCRCFEKEYRQEWLHETVNEMTPFWPGGQTVSVPLGEIPKSGPVKVYRSAIYGIERQVAEALNNGDLFGGRKYIGVLVYTSADEISPDGVDHRGSDTTLHFYIQLDRVAEVRTIGFGDQVGLINRVNNPRFDRIKQGSPVGPTTQPGAKTDVLRKDMIDDYVFALNRHPGRRVDVAVSAEQAPPLAVGPSVALDYLVTESKPWYVYVQGTNTGTAETETWREKVGVVDNNLTNHDDILTFDYTVATPNTSEAYTASYELPLTLDEKLRARVYGSADRFVASDVGESNEDFFGTDQLIGGEGIYNIFQHHDLFVDAFAGGRYARFHVINKSVSAQSGEMEYGIPYGGFRLTRASDTAATEADVTLEGGIARNGNEANLEALGRQNVASNWDVMQMNLNHSFYLEPIAQSLGLPYKPGTLANEIAVYGQYQEPFGARLIPEEEITAGGFYTVRGYPESAVVGDRAFIGTIEYRFHFPRWLDAQSTPGTLFGQPFRYAPQQPFGRADWDLISRVFVDAARVLKNDREGGGLEDDNTLVGTGVGLEFMVGSASSSQNLDVRADWGIALKDVDATAAGSGTNAGSNRFHLSFTLLY
jgi:hemolysin activation/secretion protein